ncbi:MAG: hypothetical protein EA001_03310 [Oscillatoriales cyanobacterium]|nr:MAG: hypothetical protein EA001_03310 [Oscillatoriales cyanobacterium]
MSHLNCLRSLNRADADPEDVTQGVMSPNLASAYRSLKQLASVGILLWASAAVAAVAVHPQTENLTRLQQLLADRQWQAASAATWAMLAPESRTDDLLKTECELLLEVDHLWTQASAGRFGFTVQEQVWQRLSMTPSASDPNPDRADRFRQRVGWDRFAPDSPEAQNNKGYFPSDKPLTTGKTLEFGCGDADCSIPRTEVEEQVSGIVGMLPALNRCLN